MKQLLTALTLASALFAQDEPLTTAESSGWKRTSTNADVWRFLERLDALPFRTRIVRSVLGYSVEGRRLAYVKVPSLGDDPLKVLIIADIHGGEVEGKEVVQILLREIANGRHSDLLEHLELHVVPVFNPDGNDEINRGNRVNQNGPDGGVGRRANGQGLDLNRDFVKVESPEARALIRLMNEVDPHLFMDLHTTNGSHHVYHLTYAPCLSPNQDPVLDAFMHDVFMPEVRRRAREGFAVRAFDYGNTGRRAPREGQVRRWTTFSGDARLVWNYGGLRNRLSVLSEAYSYLDFKARADATRAFVLSNLQTLIARRKEVRVICDAADLRIAEDRELRFGYDTDFAPAKRGKLLMGRVERVRLEGLGTRLVALPEFEEVEAELRIRFECKKSVKLPIAWAMLDPPQAVVDALLIHGIEVRRLGRETAVGVEEFEIEGMTRGRARFQGHRLVSFRGRHASKKRRLPAGTVFVVANQRLGRLAAQLLEPVSEDGLATWNFFDAALEANGKVHPVLRVVQGSVAGRMVLPTANTYAVAGALRPDPSNLEAPVAIEVACVEPGTRVTSGAYESEFRYEGRRVEWRLDGIAHVDAKALATALGQVADKGRPVVIRPGHQVIHAEITVAAEAARKAGFKDLFLQREPE